MGFLSRLFGRAAGSSRSGDAPGGGALWIYVRCAQCNEAIRVRLQPRTDAQPEYDESGRVTHSFLRKEILGNRCSNLMSVELHLDSRGRIAAQNAERCAIISREEYEEERRAEAR